MAEIEVQDLEEMIEQDAEWVAQPSPELIWPEAKARQTTIDWGLTFGKSGVAQAVKDGTAAVVHDGYDVQNFAEAAKDYPQLGQYLKLLKTKEPELTKAGVSSALIRDSWMSYMKSVPQLVADDEVKLSHRVNRQMLAEMMQTKEWQDLRGSTNGDDLLATIASVGSADAMVKALSAVSPGPGARRADR
jgi:hypothetical protein